MKRLKFLAGFILLLAVFSFGSYHLYDKLLTEPSPIALGATNAIPTPIALFETSLASGITSTATSMTLVSATDKDGNSLSGTYAFIIDEGTANEEFVNADCTSTACTNMTRGLSVVTGTTSIAALKHEHRRGASVKITDAPQLLILHRVVNGISTFPNKLSYTSHPTFSANTDIIDKKYADDLAIAGAPDATTSVKGITEIALTSEINSGAATGSTAASLSVRPDLLAASIYGLQLPSSGQKDALAGTSGTPSSSNKYITANDATTATTASAIVRRGSSGEITVNPTPSGGNEAASKTYVDVQIAGVGTTAFSSGTFTYDVSTASNTATVAHSLGKLPKRAKVTAVYAVTTCENTAIASYNGTTQSSVSMYGCPNGSTFTNAFRLSADTAAPTTNYSSAAITYDATNLTFTWTKTGSPGAATYQVLWEVEG